MCELMIEVYTIIGNDCRCTIDAKRDKNTGNHKTKKCIDCNYKLIFIYGIYIYIYIMYKMQIH